jgi:hypothetical protein
MTPNKKRKSVGLKIGFGSALFLLALVAVAMILLGHTPGDYLPTAIPPSGQVSPYLTQKLVPDFFNAVQVGQPFDLAIEQRYVNEIFAFTAGRMEVEGMTLSSPMVAFYPGSFVFMVTVEMKGVSSVLSVTAQPAVDEAGLLHPNIRSVTLGAIPVTDMVQRIARQYAEQYLSAETDKEIVPAINGILNNQPFEPVMKISKYTVRLKGLKLEAGKLILRVEPVEDKRGITGSRVP